MNVIYKYKQTAASIFVKNKAGQFGGIFVASGTPTIRVVDGTENSTAATGTYTLTGALTPGVRASSTITSDATAPAAGALVVIGSVTYTAVAALTGAPNEVLIGVSAATFLANLKSAINGTAAGLGVTYGLGTVFHPTIVGYTLTTTTLIVVARAAGTTANATATTTTSAHLSWAGATLGVGTTGSVTGVSADAVVLGAQTYRFVKVLAETVGAAPVPNEVLWVTSDATAFANLAKAINGTGTAGTTYGTGTVGGQEAVSTSVTSTTVVVAAMRLGTPGNAIATTTTSAGASWGATTLTGGAGADGRLIVDSFVAAAATMYRFPDIGIAQGLFVNLTNAGDVTILYV